MVCSVICRGEFESSGDVLGPGSDEVKAIEFLGRSIRLTSTGIEWEGDDKHAKAFLEKLNAGDLKGAETPGTKVESASVLSEGVPLPDADAKLYRGLVAWLYDARLPPLESLVAHAAGGRIKFGGGRIERHTPVGGVARPHAPVDQDGRLSCKRCY